MDRKKWSNLLQDVFLEVGLLYTTIVATFDDPNINDKTLIEFINKELLKEILYVHQEVIHVIRGMLMEFKLIKDNDNGFE